MYSPVLLNPFPIYARDCNLTVDMQLCSTFLDDSKRILLKQPSQDRIDKLF